jgi:hypothetical protein
MGVTFSVLVLLVGVGFLWFYVVRPILEDYNIIAPRIVNDYQIEQPQPIRVMSRENEQTSRQTETDRQTDLVSVGDEWMDRIEVDRTKTAIIELLVYSGWDVGQIRSVVKGDNGAIGLEVEAAKQRLGMSPDPPRMLRVNDNGSGERLIPMEVR